MNYIHFSQHMKKVEIIILPLGDCERLARLSTSHDVTLLYSFPSCLIIVSLPVFVEFPLSCVFV